jgi:hypothetical protein
MSQKRSFRDSLIRKNPNTQIFESGFQVSERQTDPALVKGQKSEVRINLSACSYYFSLIPGFDSF